MGQDIPSKEGDAVKFGWCGPIENALLIARVGFDFIEVPLAPLGLEKQASPSIPNSRAPTVPGCHQVATRWSGRPNTMSPALEKTKQSFRETNSYLTLLSSFSRWIRLKECPSMTLECWIISLTCDSKQIPPPTR
jgi:hypothetical protein